MFINTIMGLSLEAMKETMLNDGWEINQVEEYIFDLMCEIPLNCSNMTIEEYQEQQKQKFDNWYDQRQEELNEPLPF